MRKGVWKWFLLGGALTVIVLYGIEASTSGIERIYGPIEGGMETAAAAELPEETEPPAAQTSAKLDASAEERIEQLEEELRDLKRLAKLGAIANGVEVPEDDAPAVNRVAEGTADLLQSVTTGGIRFIVSLFDSVTN